MPAVVSYCRLTNNRLGDNFPANSLSAASLPSLLKRGLVKLSVACMGVDVGNPARNGFLPLLSVAVLLLVSSAAGQAVYGSVFGTVTDPSGAALPKASIIVTSVERASSTKGVTNDSGNYSVAQLLPGHYTVKAEAPGFRSSSVTDVPVHVDQTSRVDLRLAIGMVTEGITVSAKDVPLLKTDRTDVAVTFSQREILDVPLKVKNNFTSLELLAPGTSILGWQHASSENPQGSLQINVNGQNWSQTSYQLDGTDNRDPILGIIVINPNLEAVTETKFTTQNYDAEFDGIAGVMSTQTKSGTNQFHGSVAPSHSSATNVPFIQVPGAQSPSSHMAVARLFSVTAASPSLPISR